MIDDFISRKLAGDPENPESLLGMATVYERMKRYRQAVDLYEKLILRDESQPVVLNGLAWLLATVPDEQLRNPDRAVSLAEKAVAMQKTAGNLDTLAEAHYANGAFQQAIDIIREAISLDGGIGNYLEKQLEKFTAARDKS